MPRPGQRPYECVKRAWHSDSHHPIRGSLIQEIFRIVNEVHSSATKKNKEWQENLPIVVLKAEEIMYSKANSEAEYSNLKTLWHRVNDAIDNIIRRDESSETGEFLQPCIEAALYLGCIPRRLSRSQRNDTPRYYLRPETPESTSVPPSCLDGKLLGNYTSKSDLMLQHLKFLTTTTINSSFSDTNVESLVVRNKDCSNVKFPVLPKNLIPSGNYQSEPMQTSWSVYPLYNADQLQFDDPKFSLKQPSNTYFHPTENDKTKSIHNRSLCKADSPKITLPVEIDSNNPSEIQCDLSLRLGSPAVSCKNMNGCPQEEENGNLGNARKGRRKLSDDFSFFVQAKNKEVCWQLSLHSMKE
ncbi:uncharacterized protein LOC111382085 [Olea europaea subsp. europaea]|uniref:Uncharacterized protein LOC111382085 n=1 Tax=Olea europaea subsp. europaea TaxID=158383 RepID=A0A8S0UTE2_OLEEU|nr:uncharacterized protein LOC111382085 [Olea europaea subsp. europaea]